MHKIISFFFNHFLFSLITIFTFFFVQYFIVYQEHSIVFLILIGLYILYGFLAFIVELSYDSIGKFSAFLKTFYFIFMVSISVLISILLVNFIFNFFNMNESFVLASILFILLAILTIVSTLIVFNKTHSYLEFNFIKLECYIENIFNIRIK